MRDKEESCGDDTGGNSSVTDPGKPPYCYGLAPKAIYFKENGLRTTSRPNPKLSSNLLMVPDIYLCQPNGEPLHSLPSSGATSFTWLIRPGCLPVSLLPTMQVREITSLAGKDPMCTMRQIFR